MRRLNVPAVCSLALFTIACDPSALPGGEEPGAESPEDDGSGEQLDGPDGDTEDDVDGNDGGGGEEEPVFVAVPQAGLEIEVASGAVRGVQEGTSRVFKGIPFAEPPIGERRFRAPVPIGAWQGVRDTNEFGASCPQDMNGLEAAMGDAAANISEDCLSLNVWAHDDDVQRPVMVFIYGGGFVVGSSAWSPYDATSLSQTADAVVVTLNYRLGMLGFLGTEKLAAENDDGSAGNWGIRDQIEALRWVKQNIAAFGGDPDNVTIFGESAGAISVCTLLAAPSADDLFHKAIIESGSCSIANLRGDGMLGLPNTIDGGESLVEAVGCADAFDELACLRSKPASDLVAVTGMGDMLSGDFSAIAALSPTVDGVLIPEQPIDRLASGDVDKPLIVGSNRDEGGLFTGLDVVVTRWDLRNKFESFLGDDPVVDELMDLYPATDFFFPKDAWSAFMGEVMFICPGLSAADAAASGSPAYAYHFTRTMLMTAAMGAAHGLELPYVFGTFSEMAMLPTAADLELSEKMQTAWGTFAHTGTPSLEPTWDAFDPSAPAIAILDDDVEMTDGIRAGRCDSLTDLGLVF